MIKINMRVPHRMYERPRNQIAHMRQHMRQQRIRSDIERNPQSHIAGPLIQLTRKPTFRLFPRFGSLRRPTSVLRHRRLLRITHVELRKHVTRRQRHLAQIRHIPRTQHNPPIIRLCSQFFYDIRQLIEPLPRIIRCRIDIFGAEMAPLEAVHGAQVAFGAGSEADAVEVCAGAVPVPDFDAGRGEGEGGCGAGDEPEEFGDDGAEEDAFCG